jgi:hypothetical protein
VAESGQHGHVLYLDTAEGKMFALEQDWLARDAEGAFHALSAEGFARDYEPVDEMGEG